MVPQSKAQTRQMLLNCDLDRFHPFTGHEGP